MAFDRTKLGGNICASSEQSSFFIYTSDVDTLAIIATVDYFIEANGSNPPANLTGPTGNKDDILYENDIILFTATDGTGVGKVLPDGASISLVLQGV